MNDEYNIDAEMNARKNMVCARENMVCARENNPLLERVDKSIDALIDYEDNARILIEEIISELISDLK